MVGVLERFGWEAEVLAVKPNLVDAPVDLHLEKAFPKPPTVHLTGAWNSRWTRKIGLGGLGYRAGWQLGRAGERLLRHGGFDLIFFSTTEFPCLRLVDRWAKRFGLPVVIDMQDPWVNDYYDRHPEVRPPGGRWKYGFAQWLARRFEPPAIRAASHIICVSDAYTRMFQGRYPDLPDKMFTVIPFAVAETDFEYVRSMEVGQHVFDQSDGFEHWVYVGAVPPSMMETIRGIFEGLCRFWSRNPGRRDRVRIHFVGTNYATGSRVRSVVAELAASLGLEDVVSESPERISYHEALRCLVDADALLMPGTTDPGYSASKVYPCLFAGTPMLAVFDTRSDIFNYLKRVAPGYIVGFEGGETSNDIAERVDAKLETGWPAGIKPVERGLLEHHTAVAMTRRVCSVFDGASSS